MTGVDEIVLRIEQEVLREVTEEMLRQQGEKRRGNQSPTIGAVWRTTRTLNAEASPS